MNRKSAPSTTESNQRPLRSNTDLTSKPIPSVINQPVEKLLKKVIASTPESQATSEERDQPIQETFPPPKSPVQLDTNNQVIPQDNIESDQSVLPSETSSDSNWDDNEVTLFNLNTSESRLVTSTPIPTMGDSKEDLSDDRTTLRRRITTIQYSLNQVESQPLSKERIEMKLDDLQGIKSKVDQIQERTTRLFRKAAPAELAEAISLDSELHDAWELATLQAHEIKNKLESSTISRVKIPKAEPPEFDGQAGNWSAFLDQFNSMVVNNSKVSSTDKLSLLKKSLEKGSAYTLVQNFPLTDVDWDNAWSAVKSRYDHERELAYSALNKLFELTPISHQNQNGIRHILDTINDVIRALNNLKVETSQWDLFLIFIIRKNLDSRTKTEFEKSLPDNKIHSLKVFTDYLNNLATALSIANADNNLKLRDRDVKPKAPEDQQKGKQDSNSKVKLSCSFCSKPHWNSTCPSLLALIPAQRIKLATEKNLCKNCLRPATEKHKTTTCTCGPCRVCKQKHHSLLHLEPKTTNIAAASATSSQPKRLKEEAPTALSATQSNSGVNCLLGTAKIIIVHKNKSHQLRVIVDQGSQVNLMSEKLANKLQLKREPSTVNISGIGNKSTFAKGKTTIQVQSIIDSSWSSHVNCLIVPQVTGNKPPQSIDTSKRTQFRNLKLADDTFNEPGPIDLLLGTQFFMDILGNHHFHGYPSALETKLGYIILGEFDLNELPNSVCTLTCDVDFDLSRFWDQEELPSKCELTPEEQEVETHFASTHKREDDGKFVVQLPIIPNHKPLGESKAQAKQRLFQIERKLEKFPDKKKFYHQGMESYINSNHLIQVPQKDKSKPEDQVFYLPHHYVEKESTSTPFRIVFDGSARSSSGQGLNDIIRSGPVLLNNLVQVLFQFREHKYVFTGDVKKMYLQIGIYEPHQDYLRVLWRESPNYPIKEYRFAVVPFGTTSSPYLAIKCLHQLCLESIIEFPLGAQVLKEDMYLDDCLSGDKDLSLAMEKQQQVIKVSSKGCFSIRRWSSNHPKLLESIPVEDRETQLPLEIDSTDHVKTLGILWDPAMDIFTFKVNTPADQEFTKRKVASYAAKTYDPTGLIQPVIVKSKIILQNLWASKVDWDQVIPSLINDEWNMYLNQLSHLEGIQIPRHLFPGDPNKILMHGFSDASPKAYGAVIYLVSKSESQCTSRLLTSKSKVAPIKFTSIPRLELMGAVLLSKLMQTARKFLRTEPHEVHYWCDSSIVLNQINKPSRDFKVFVANRVAQVQGHSNVDQWHYVNTKDNPADLVSRGLFPSELVNNKFWWNGPSWLESEKLPIGPIPGVQADTDLEQVPITSLSTEVTESWTNWAIKKFNSILSLKRATTLMLRMFRGLKKPHNSILISAIELDEALKIWIKLIQAEQFKQEIKWIMSGKEFPKSSHFKSLAPFIDSIGILRVGGRLSEAVGIPEDTKHPILLPKNHPIVNLIIKDVHDRFKHAGPTLMTNIIRSNYWIFGLKPSLNRYIKNCLICQKVAAEVGQQLMGSLPSSRISQARPFLHTGLDYAGPINILPKSGRGQKLMKAWIAIFVCFSTKAVHLELVSQLSTEALIAALKRFTSRRGKPQVIRSDEGTNFVGAKNQFNSFQQEMESIAYQDEVAAFLASEGITWKLNPPGAPHMGGLWEAAVKSMKHHLRRAGDSANFTIEEMTTLLCEIEACLNSRPLTPMSNDPNDFQVLTPGHFLVGHPMAAIPEHDLTQININRLDRWQIIQQQKNHFWKRWSSEYLHTLQNRPKWMNQKSNFQIGDLVLIKDESLPPLKWKVGRVIQTYPGKDNQVRVVSVKISTIKVIPKVKGLERFKAIPSIMKRPIHKLVPLPYDNQENQDNPNPTQTTEDEFDN